MIAAPRLDAWMSFVRLSRQALGAGTRDQETYPPFFDQISLEQTLKSCRGSAALEDLDDELKWDTREFDPPCNRGLSEKGELPQLLKRQVCSSRMHIDGYLTAVLIAPGIRITRNEMVTCRSLEGIGGEGHGFHST